MDDSERLFRDALLEAANQCRRIGYIPKRFIGMVKTTNPFEVVRSLLNASATSDGFTTLWEKKRLDLTVEAFVLKPEWKRFFSPAEQAIARSRLAEVGYFPEAAQGRVFETPHIENQPRDDSAGQHEIARLLDELANSKGDTAVGKRIRSRLRALGHFGGLAGLSESDESPRTNSPAHTFAAVVPSLPPIPDPEALLARIRSIAGLPERNNEDVVKDLLVRLGHHEHSIVFQRGRIDVCIMDQNKKPIAVLEVKRSIASDTERLAARRQAMDYSGITGAPVLVITDGDRYEIYDRRRGFDFDAMLCGRFRLTAFHPNDEKVLDLLKPGAMGLAQ